MGAAAERTEDVRGPACSKKSTGHGLVFGQKWAEKLVRAKPRSTDEIAGWTAMEGKKLMGCLL
jgi:hypothetical protein